MVGDSNVYSAVLEVFNGLGGIALDPFDLEEIILAIFGFALDETFSQR